ncbi:MAG TPA: hypothetical protein PK358_07930 [Spirochaetota bacterium]|nr:hypothetical protein [Spirochaetota bacterium]
MADEVGNIIIRRIISAASVSVIVILLITLAFAAGKDETDPGCIVLDTWELTLGSEHIKTPPVPWGNNGICGAACNTGIYRIEFVPPLVEEPEQLAFFTPALDDADRAYLNGELIGCTGVIPEAGVRAFRSGVREPRLYILPESVLKRGKTNTLEIRVYNFAGAGGFAYPQLPLIGPYHRLKLKEWKHKIINDYIRLVLTGAMICIAIIILYQLISLSDKSGMVFTLNKIIDGMNPVNIFRKRNLPADSDYRKEIIYKYTVSLLIIICFILYLFSELPGKYIFIESEEFWFRAPLIFLMSGMILVILLFYSDVFREGSDDGAGIFNVLLLMKIVTHPFIYLAVLSVIIARPVEKAWAGFTITGIAAVSLCFFILIIRSVFILIAAGRRSQAGYSAGFVKEGVIRIILLAGFTVSIAVFSSCGSFFYMHSSIISIAMLTVYMFLSVSFNIRFKTEFPVYISDSDSLTDYLRDNFNLSITESAIAGYINRGFTRDDICRMFNITQGTLKNHLKSIYSKTIELNSNEISTRVGKYQRLTVFLHNIYNMSHKSKKKL